jgi:serine protease Do
MRYALAVSIAAASVILAGSVLAQADVDMRSTETLEQAAPPETVYVSRYDPQALSNSFVNIAKKVRPSVVTVTSTTTMRRVVPSFPLFPSPFSPWGSRRFSPREEEYQRRGLGSGTIYSPDGYVLTNNHVVSGADAIEVVLSDGSRYPAELVGTDPRTDVAVIKIDAQGLHRIPMGDSDALSVGEWVLAIGSPFALSQTVTEGIVSYLERTDIGLADYESYIQTSAAINPGNSGGPLVNLNGEVVGINSAIASRSGGSEGVGFAIPINVAIRVADDLIEFGAVRRGWIGVMIQEVSPQLADQFDAPEGAVLISDVLEDTPAERAGLERGDVVVSLNGKEVRSASGFRNDVADLQPGSEVRLSILRDGDRISLEVTLDQQPEDLTAFSGTDPGWTLSSLDVAELDALGIIEGVLVSSIESGGPAADAGVKSGDVILEVNRVTVSSPEEVRQIVRSSAGEVLLLVLRGDNTIYLVMEI